MGMSGGRIVSRYVANLNLARQDRPRISWLVHQMTWIDINGVSGSVRTGNVLKPEAMKRVGIEATGLMKQR